VPDDTSRLRVVERLRMRSIVTSIAAIWLAGALALVGAATASAAGGTGAITGKVTDASSKAAIAGIEVCAAENLFEIELILYAELPGHCTQTGAGGEYTIAELPAGKYGVGYSAPEGSGLNYVTQYYDGKISYAEAQPVSVTAGSTTSEINAAMVMGGEISGEVTSAATKAGIAGIEVCPRSASGEYTGPCTTTNAGGEYTMAALAGGEYTIEFSPSDGANYLTQYYDDKSSISEAGLVTVSAGGKVSGIDATMAAGGEITGTVTSASSKAALAEVEVCPQSANGAYDGQCTWTSSSGEYTLAGLATGKYDVGFYPSYGSNYLEQYYDGKSSLAEAEPVTVEAGHTTTGIAAAMQTGGEVTGKVTSASSSAAIDGIEVCLLTASGDYEGYCTTTDSSGEYTIVGLNTGEYKVEFSATGGANYVTQYYNGVLSSSEAEVLSVQAGHAASGIDAAMAEGGRIAGTVTSAATEAAIGDISVCADPVGGGTGECASTNSAGEYTIVALATGEYTVYFSGYPDYLYQDYGGGTVPVTADATTPGINAALVEGGQITGKVTSASGKAPLSGIEVCPLSTAGYNDGGCASTNSSGEYTIFGLAAGEYKVEFYIYEGTYFTQYYDGKSSAAEAAMITVTAGATTSGIDAAMVEGGKITGKVTSAATKAGVGDVYVCADEQGTEIYGRCTYTNAAGEYTISGLSASQYSIYFEPFSGNYLPQYYNDEPSASEATLLSVGDGVTTSGIDAALAAGGEIKGTVTSAASKAGVEDIEVCAWGIEEGEYGGCALTGTAGEYTIEGLSTGDYTVQFSSAYESGLNYLPQYYNGKPRFAEAEPVPVTAGSTTPKIDAAMAAGGQISGTVTAASSKAALKGVEVCAQPTGERPSETSGCAETDAGGEYTLSGLATGEYVVEFSGPYDSSVEYAEQYYEGKSSYSEADPVVVTAGAAKTDIDAAMLAMGEITGTVTSASSNSPLAGIQVCPLTTYGGYGGQCTTSNAKGEYSISGLSTGEYKVDFSIPYGSNLNYLPQYYNGKESESEAGSISVSIGSVTSEIDAAMQTGGEITGKVTNASNKAGLGGIEVCPQKATGSSSSAQCAASNANGEYKLVGLATGEYWVEFYSDTGANFVTQYYDAKSSYSEANLVSVTAGSTTPEIDAAMVVGGRIAGKVTDASTKAALADIQVCAQPKTGGGESHCTDTNAGGEYTLVGLATGEYEVEFSTPYGSNLNYLPQYYDGKESVGEATAVAVTVGATAGGIDAAMNPGGKIAGKVTDAATRDGLGDVEVCLEASQATYFSDCVYTNGDGEYAIAGLATGEYKVEFESFAGYSTQYYDNKGSASEADPVSVTEGSTTPNIGAAMVVGGQITGTVTSAASKAGIEGIEVCAYGTSGEEEDFTRCSSTGPDGEYTIDGLVTSEYQVEFDPNGQDYIGQYYDGKEFSSEADLVSVTYGSTASEVNATLAVGGQITGRVTNASTKAALGGITVCPEATNGGPFLSCTTSNTSGEYALVGLATGEYKLEFYPADGANYLPQYYDGKSAYSEAEPVSVKAGSTTTEVDAAMVVGGQIAGKVTNASTKAGVGGVSVCPRPVGVQLIYSQCATTNSSGEYTIDGLVTGDYKVEFSAYGQNYLSQYYSGATSESEAQAVSVTAGSTSPGVDAAMIVGGQITGKVVEASTNAALADIEVCSSPAEEEEFGFFGQCAFTNDNGEYAIIALSTGQYDVRFSSPEDAYVTQYYDLKTSPALADAVTVTTGSPTGSIDAELASLPVATEAPTISGTAQQGHTLTEVHGSWTGHPTEYAYQWELCNATGGECAAIFEATGQTYVPTLADAGHRLRVSEIASNVAGTGAPAVSAPTAVVLPLPPVNVTPPSISGTAQQGKTLTEAHGSWENDPTEYTYQWERCGQAGEHCTAISGATEQT